MRPVARSMSSTLIPGGAQPFWIMDSGNAPPGLTPKHLCSNQVRRRTLRSSAAGVIRSRVPGPVFRNRGKSSESEPVSRTGSMGADRRAESSDLRIRVRSALASSPTAGLFRGVFFESSSLSKWMLPSKSSARAVQLSTQSPQLRYSKPWTVRISARWMWPQMTPSTPSDVGVG